MDPKTASMSTEEFKRVHCGYMEKLKPMPPAKIKCVHCPKKFGSYDCPCGEGIYTLRCDGDCECFVINTKSDVPAPV